MSVESGDDIVSFTPDEVSRVSAGEPQADAFPRVELVHPPRAGIPSGGHVYNKRLLEAARLRGLPWVSREMEPSDIDVPPGEDATCFRVWDSLFLEALGSRDLTCSGQWGLLLHYLPSLDPTLDRPERARLARLEERAVGAASRVIVTGRALRSPIEERHPHVPVFVCEPGISEAFLDPLPARAERARCELQLLTVANFLPAKGLLELLFALSRVFHIDWRWHVIGDAARNAVYTSRFDAAARQLGLDSRIVRHGVLDQRAIASRMDAMDLFVCASRFEAYGMALAEAAARCLPTVTTDVGAAASLFEQGSTGLLAPADDGPRFVAHLQRLMGDAALRERFRENLRSRKPRTWQDTLGEFRRALARTGDRT